MNVEILNPHKPLPPPLPNTRRHHPVLKMEKEKVVKIGDLTGWRAIVVWLALILAYGGFILGVIAALITGG
jgi:hypothetical protein